MTTTTSERTTSERYRKVAEKKSRVETRRKIARQTIRLMLSAADEALEYAEDRNPYQAAYWKGYNQAVRAMASALSLRPKLWDEHFEQQLAQARETTGKNDTAEPTSYGSSGVQHKPNSKQLERYNTLPPRLKRTVLLFAQQPELTGREVARLLDISESTVYWYTARARRTIGLKNRAAFRRFALAHGLIQP